MENNEFKFLGKTATVPSRILDVFPCPENVTVVKFESNEFTSFCPVTHQPDFNHIIIEFAPDKLCIESKSLKLYLWSFRDEAVFAEGLANIIAEDLYNAILPYWCKITLNQNIRGGIQLSVVSEKNKPQ
jgi:7-cyano-7-deazaguanine reductase